MTVFQRASFSTVAFLLLMGVGIGVHAASKPEPLTLELIRAIRVSDSSISITFMTSEAAVGEVIYASSKGHDVTLTDSTPEVDHLFTLEKLTPTHGYTFKLRATQGSAESNSYVILLAPENVGEPGQSIMPAMQIISPDGTLVTSVVAASGTPATSEPILPWWVFIIFGTLFFGGWLGKKYFDQKNEQKEDFTYHTEDE